MSNFGRRDARAGAANRVSFTVEPVVVREWEGATKDRADSGSPLVVGAGADIRVLTKIKGGKGMPSKPNATKRKPMQKIWGGGQ